MSTPVVAEVIRRPEAVAHDTFIDDLARAFSWRPARPGQTAFTRTLAVAPTDATPGPLIRPSPRPGAVGGAGGAAERP